MKSQGLNTAVAVIPCGLELLGVLSEKNKIFCLNTAVAVIPCGQNSLSDSISPEISLNTAVAVIPCGRLIKTLDLLQKVSQYRRSSNTLWSTIK